jgi:glycosyltransferase involved in cell wall biosynthesis
MGPLVSCIMPTQNRRRFIPRAIESFLLQDWPEKELVVVDSGDDRVEDLIREVPNAKYIFYTEPRSEWLPNVPIGTKRNIACENASGEIIVHFDDDDYSHPGRISNQIKYLRESGKSVVGYNWIKEFSEFTTNTNDYQVPPGWAAGTSLCYLKAYWEKHRFPATSFGEDWTFIEVARDSGEFASCDGQKYITSTAHSGNTCKRG